MRRVVRRTDTVVTVQTWTVTWVEDVPASEPPAAPLPALPPGPAPQAPAADPETPPTLPAAPDSNAD